MKTIEQVLEWIDRAKTNNKNLLDKCTFPENKKEYFDIGQLVGCIDILGMLKTFILEKTDENS